MTWRDRNLYLIGLPGAGKSAIGQELVALLENDRFRFVDLDTEIEKAASKSVGDIFSEDGEDRFRELETEALVKASHQDNLIVATGGGIVLNSLNRSVIRGSGVSIWIDVTTRTAVRNVLGDIKRGKTRPLFAGTGDAEIQATMRDLLELRRPYYEQAQLHFVTRSPKGDEYSTSELAEQLHIALNEMSQHVRLPAPFHTVLAKSALGDYPIFVGTDVVLRELPNVVLSLKAANIVTITDTNVDRLYGQQFCAALSEVFGGKCTIHNITIEAGESHKSTRTLFDILDRFRDLELNRCNSVVIALGGGVVTDISGLAANLYHRGLPIISIPTTLIGQADAAIGGKTGIDYLGAKNAVGTIYPPRHVLVDPTFLATLPTRELHAGLAEVLKYALIGSQDLWGSLSANIQRLIRGVDDSYQPIIYQSVVEKLKYVQSDEFERASGIRVLLNFGHTFGHALESATAFKSLLHGEAVLLGMRGAVWLSKELGYLPDDSWREIEGVLSLIPIDSHLNTTVTDVFTAFRQDKKHASKGEYRVVLLHSIGDAFVDTISESDAKRTIEYILRLV